MLVMVACSVVGVPTVVVVGLILPAVRSGNSTAVGWSAWACFTIAKKVKKKETNNTLIHKTVVTLPDTWVCILFVF